MLKLHTKPRKKLHFALGLLFASILIGVIIFLPPEGILVKAAFFLLLFCTLFYLLRYLFNQTRRALLLSAGLTFYFILRFLDLRHWLYPLLIGALLISIEVYNRKK